MWYIINDTSGRCHDRLKANKQQLNLMQLSIIQSLNVVHTFGLSPEEELLYYKILLKASTSKNVSLKNVRDATSRLAALPRIFPTQIIFNQQNHKTAISGLMRVVERPTR